MTPQQWLTFYVQTAVALPILGFAVLGIAIGRQPRGVHSFHRAAWLLTGWAFLAHGIDKTTQDVFGYFAMRGGPGSAPWDAFVRTVPVFNHSRTFLLAGFLFALLVLTLLKDLPTRRFWWGAGLSMFLGLTMGAGLGLVEGGFVENRHLTRAAGYDAIELAFLMAALLGLLLTERGDRHLWAALAVYGVSLALSVSWLTALAQAALGWAPEVFTFPLVRLVARCAMVGIAAHRLLLARKGIAVPGLTGRYASRPSLTGLR